MLARLMESQIWHLPAGFVALLGEGSEKEKLPLPTCVDKSSPPALALVPDISVPPHVPLLPFKLPRAGAQRD